MSVKHPERMCIIMTNVNAAQDNSENTETVPTFDPTGQTPLNLEDYVASLQEALKDNPDATQDLNVLLTILQANIQFFAQNTGVVLMFFYTDDGQLALVPARIRR